MKMQNIKIKYFMGNKTDGKTRIATNAIKLLRRNNATRSVVIVVPTIPLKEQWEEGLNLLGLSENTKVYVVNTLIKMDAFECSLLILDEIHRYAAETFSKLFDVAKYSFVLGLTATLKRLDAKHVTLEKYAPICDKVTMVEGKKNGWVAPFTEYNLGLELSDLDREIYHELSVEFARYFDKFQNDFDLMRRCSMTDKPAKAQNGSIFEPRVVKYARSLGWRGNSAIVARNIMIYNRTAPRGQKRDMWGNEQHPYSPQKLFVYAIQGMRVNREIVSFVYNNKDKINAAEQIIRAFPESRAITFCQTTNAADELARRLGSISVPYHSNLESTEVLKTEVKHYKTEKGADNWIEKNPEWGNKKLLNSGKYSISRRKIVKVSANQQKNKALDIVQNSRRTRVICTAKALDQGVDFPACSLGVSYARTSSSTQQVQRTGRVVRKHFFEDGTEKRSVMINIYLKDTKDFNWLKRAQKNSAGVRWIDSIEEIIEAENMLMEW